MTDRDLSFCSIFRVSCADAKEETDPLYQPAFGTDAIPAMLAYEAYFDALEPLRTTTNEWKSILAGLVVLRLVDDWLDGGPCAIKNNPANVQSVREAVARVAERDPVRQILCDLVDVVTQSETATVQAIAEPMLAYGNMLESTGQWSLSRDVFASLLNRAQTIQNRLIAARAARRFGLVLRLLGQVDASDRAYNLTRQNAVKLKAPEIYLQSRMGYANNLIVRGRLTDAETIIDAVAVEARSLDMTDFYVCALGIKSNIAIERKDYLAGIHACQTALMHVSEPIIRDALVGDVGGASVGYGDHNTAKKILIPLLRTTQEESVRQSALVNLLEIAAKDGDRPTFERYRQKLEGTLTLPFTQAYYHLFLGKGYHKFGLIAKAIEEQQCALAIAERYGLHQARTTILDDPSVRALSQNKGTSGVHPV